MGTNSQSWKSCVYYSRSTTACHLVIPCKQNNYERLSTTNAQTFFFLLESTVIHKSNFQSLSVEEKSAASIGFLWLYCSNVSIILYIESSILYIESSSNNFNSHLKVAFLDKYRNIQTILIFLKQKSFWNKLGCIWSRLWERCERIIKHSMGGTDKKR